MKISELPSSSIYIIQGDYSTEKVLDIPVPVNWMNWKDKNILKDQIILGVNFQKLLAKLSTHKIISLELVKNLDAISKIISFSHSFKQEIPSVCDIFRKYDVLFEFLNLSIERVNLEEELRWAQIIEAQSKSTIDMNLLQRINEEIDSLSKRILVMKPQYEFLKNTEEEYIESLIAIKKNTIRINKTYRTKTSQINKLKREIDAEKPRRDQYEEKLEELAANLPPLELSGNTDYIRISKKLSEIEDKNASHKITIDSLSQEILQDKRSLKEIKNQLTELNRNHGQNDSKYAEIEKSYIDLKNTLEKKESEKEHLLQNQTLDLGLNFKGNPPERIRFSSIIEAELKSNTIQISRYCNLSEISEYLPKLIKELHLDKTQLQKVIKPQIDVPEESFIQFQEIVQKIEERLNAVFHRIDTHISITKIPLIALDKESIPQFGIQFELKKQKKLKKFEKFPVEEKLFLMWSFEHVLNGFAGINTSVFTDTDYKMKRTKSIMEKIVEMIKNGFFSKDEKIVILLSKPILEDTSQQEIVIKTIIK